MAHDPMPDAGRLAEILAHVDRLERSLHVALQVIDRQRQDVLTQGRLLEEMGDQLRALAISARGAA